MALVFEVGFTEGSGTTAADTSGNARTFTAVGAPWNASGKNNSCLAASTGNYFNRTAGVGSGGLTTWSLMMWHYRTSTPGTWGQLLYDGAGTGFWPEIASDGKFDFNGDVVSPSAIPLNTWTHIAVVCSSNALTLYIGGTSVATGTWTGTLDLGTTWSIGNGPDGPAPGRLDEVRFFNNALTGAEVVTYMNTAIGSAAPVDVTAPFTGSGSLTAATEPVRDVTAPFTGSGTLTAVTTAGNDVDAPFTGSGTLTAALSVQVDVTAPFSGSGALTAALSTTQDVTAPFTGSGTLSAVAAKVGGFPFVTSIDATGRFFRDQNGAPILIKGDSPWSAFVDLSTTEWETWCANRESHGFNAASVSLLGNPENGGPNANGATFDGIQPFTGTFTPNPTYWARIDTFVQTAADHGITLFLYASDGWVVNTGLSGVISTMNSTQAQAYGAFVATRYASAPNIMWMSGGDFFPGVGTDETISQNVLTGIRSVDTLRPHTMQAMYQRSASRQWSTWASKVQWDFIYTRYPGYELLRKSFARTPAMPAVFGEGIYDGMYSGTTAQSELASRLQIGWALSSGAAGDFYGTEDWQFGSGWAGRLDRNSAVQADRMRSAVESVDWWKLEPSPSFITSGAGTAYVFPNEPSPGSDPGFPNLTDSGAPSGAAGTIHTHTYATAAVSSDGAVAVVYLPTQRAITIDTSMLGSSPTGSWVNTTTGASSAANLASLTPPSSGDWLLLLEAVPVVVDVSAGFTGSGSLTATVIPGQDVSAALTGSGSLTAALERVHDITAPFTGTGTLTSTLEPVLDVTATLTGSGTLTASMEPVADVTAPFTGSGTFTALVDETGTVNATFTGAGSLTAAIEVIAVITAALTGTGTLTAALNMMVDTTAMFAGTGNLTATVIQDGYTPPNYPARRTLTGTRHTIVGGPRRTLEEGT